MAHALARPEDILVAYDPDTVSVGNQADPLEVHGGRGAFREMTGGADTYHEDFTSGLRDFVAARQAAGGFDDPTGGSTLVGGWFGGAGADPSALVVGLDWLAENRGDDSAAEDSGGEGSAAEDGDDEGGLLSHVVSAPPPVRRSPEMGDLSAFILSTGDADRPADGLEAALAASDEDEATAAPRVAARSDNLPELPEDTAPAEFTPPDDSASLDDSALAEPPRRRVADLGEMMRDVAPPEEEPSQPRPDVEPSLMDLGAAVTSTAPRTLSADPIEDDFVVIPAADESLGAGQPAWDLDLGAPGPVTTMGAGPRKEAE
jgi:hypothetical protein